MDDTDRKDELETLFELARDEPVPQALMARVLDDALSVQAELEAANTATARASAGGLFSGIWAALGGWPAATGLVTATVAGVWIGFSPSLGVADAMASALGAESSQSYVIDFATGFEFAFEEGEAG